MMLITDGEQVPENGSGAEDADAYLTTRAEASIGEIRFNLNVEEIKR